MLLTEQDAAERAGVPIVFFGGKGGVGKTTLAAAHALALADAGQRTLLLSTDPAHSLGDVLDRRLSDSVTEVVDRLWVREPDADAAVRRRAEQVIADAEQAVPREIMPAVRRHLQHATAGPGMADSALADELITAMAQVPQQWDRLVVDSAPTGHLLRMLSLPELLTPWVRGVARQRERAVRAERFAVGVAGGSEAAEPDPLLSTLHDRRRRVEEAARRLRADAAVRLVLLPRRMVLAETERAARELTSSGMRLGPVLLNQIGPDADETVCAAVRRRFATEGVVHVASSPTEPIGIDALRALATAIR